MAKLQCSCGNEMSNSNAPSENILRVFFKNDVDENVRSRDISLYDYETDAMLPSNHEYWYCPKCQRIHIVENVPSGEVIRRYIRATDSCGTSPNNLIPIYVYTDTEIYDAEEDNFNITLSHFIEKNGESHLFYVDPDTYAIYKRTDNGLAKLMYKPENEKSRQSLPTIDGTAS